MDYRKKERGIAKRFSGDPALSIVFGCLIDCFNLLGVGLSAEARSADALVSDKHTPNTQLLFYGNFQSKKGGVCFGKKNKKQHGYS